MSRLFGDEVTPEQEAILIEQIRQMSPQEKLQRVAELNRQAECEAIARLRASFPDASAHEIRMRLGVERNGAELMRLAYGWESSG